MFKKVSIILFALWIAIPALAYNLPEEDADALDNIVAAINHTLNQDSFRVHTHTNMEQWFEMPTGRTNIAVTQTVSGDMYGQYRRVGDRWDSAVVVDQHILSETEGFNQEITMTNEMILLDEVIYLRYSDVSPSYMQSTLPQDWIEFNERRSPRQYSGLAGMTEDFLQVQLNPNGWASQYALGQLNTETVDTLEVVDLAFGNFQTYRLEINAQAIFTSEFIVELLGILNWESLGISVEDLQFGISDDSLITYTLLVGQDDKLVYQFNTEMNITMTFDASVFGLDEVLSVDQVATSTTRYYDFGETIEINEPTLGSDI